jgi:hypothetical protein
VFERGGHCGEPGRWQRRLDEPEELALLDQDVVREALAELAQRCRAWRLVDGERVGARANSNVVAERASDERVVGIGVRGVGGQKYLLLEPENGRGRAPLSTPRTPSAPPMRCRRLRA